MISIKPLDSIIDQQQYGDMTYRQYADAYNIDDRKVPYGPDMFYLSVNTIAAKNFTFAVDGDGELVAAHHQHKHNPDEKDPVHTVIFKNIAA